MLNNNKNDTVCSCKKNSVSFSSTFVFKAAAEHLERESSSLCDKSNSKRRKRETDMETYKILYRANTSPWKLTRDCFVHSCISSVRFFVRENVRERLKRFETKCNLPVFEYSPPESSEVVILYLHGSGERGKDLWRLRLDSLKLVTNLPKVPYPVVAPICP